MTEIAGFQTGQYHKRYEKYFGGNIFFRSVMWNTYKTSRNIIQSKGWQNPLTQKSPIVLLSGTGTSVTTSTFVSFILSQNKKTKIYILDKSSTPLENSKKRLKEEHLMNNNITFVQEDILKTSFKPNYFDLIETDFLLEFFPKDVKLIAVKEWYRILKPNGIVTTRDWIEPKNQALEKQLNKLVISGAKLLLNVKIHKTTKMEYISLFQKAGFEIVITEAKLPILGVRTPLIHFMTARKI